MYMIRILIAIAALGLAGTSFAQDGETDFTPLQEMMTAKEFVDSGLHELSQQQLDALNEWIRANMKAAPGQASGQSGQQVAGATEGDLRGLHVPEQGGDIHSRIIGEFKGWSGYTEFHLENGMVWQQISSDNMKGVRMTDPKVRIYQGLMGGWRLEVEGINKTTQVKRIK